MFGIVGAVGTVINTGLLYLLTVYGNVYYLVSSIIATEVAIVSNFLGNYAFTFKDSKDPAPAISKFAKFQLVSLITIIGTVIILWALTTSFGLRYLVVWNVIAILVMFVFNFILNSKFTWKDKKLVSAALLFIIVLSGNAVAALVTTSQMGYHPDGYKQATVYLDDNSEYFDIIGAGGVVKARYNLAKAFDAGGTLQVDCQGGLPCTVGDFSDFKESGEYYLRSENGEESEKFKIGEDIYKDNMGVLLDFFDAQKQQGSSYHADFHSYNDPALSIIADGSFIMEAGQASQALVRLGNAYRHNPQLFIGENAVIREHIADYVHYLEGLQGLDIEERTDGTGFRINPHVEVTGAFVPGATNLTTLAVYTPGNPPQLLKTIGVTSLCGNKTGADKQECLDYAATYYKCQADEPCLNLTYQERTGVVDSNDNGYAVSTGWGYEFGCYVDVDVDEELFDSSYNPCLVFHTSTNSKNTIMTLTGYLMAMEAIQDLSPGEANALLQRSVATYDYIDSNYNFKSDKESAAYWGTSAFLLYDYTGDESYLEEAYSVRANVDKDFNSDNVHGNEFYWEQYIQHEEDIEDIGTYKISGKDPAEFFRNKIFGDYKDRGHLSMAKNGERVFQYDPNIKFQNSRYMLTEALYAAKAEAYYEESESFIEVIANNQLAWLTGMNAVQQGVGANVDVGPISFIHGIGDYPDEFHSRYLFDSGYSTATNGKIVGARGTSLQFFDGDDYIYLDGAHSILGKELGSLGNGYNGEDKLNGFNVGREFSNGEDHINGWINGAFDISEDNDVIFNYKDDIDTYEFTETSNEIVASAIELFAYMDYEYNEAGPEDEENESEAGLYIISNPIANVKIDGEEQGTTPLNLTLNAGSHSVVVYKTGYVTNTTSITLQNGQNLKLNVTLKVNSTIPTNQTNSTDNVSIIKSETSLVSVNNSNYSYLMSETENATFKVTLNKNETVTWKINNEVVNISSDKINHTFVFRPDIDFTAVGSIVDITASTVNQSKTWKVKVNNVMNAVFLPGSGTGGTTLNIDSELRFKDMIIVIAGPSEKTYTLVNGTSWAVAIASSDLSEGTYFLTKISGKREDGKLFNHTLTTKNIKFTKTVEAPPSNNNDDSDDSGNGPSGNTNNPGNQAARFDLVYVILDKDVISIIESQKITLDAESNKNIETIEAHVRSPSGTTMIMRMENTAGTRNYGTWTGEVNPLEPGLHQLYMVKMSTRSGDSETFNVDSREFYVVSDNVGNESLMIVYTALDKSTVDEPTNVTLTLDARDSVGITGITAQLKIVKGRTELGNIEIPLSIAAGDGTYGTWTGQIEVNSSDTTYTIESITLTNGEKTEVREIVDRSIYATNSVGPEETIGGGLNLLTGGVIGVNLREEIKKPFFPALVGLFLLFLIFLTVFVHKKVKENRRKPDA